MEVKWEYQRKQTLGDLFMILTVVLLTSQTQEKVRTLKVYNYIFKNQSPEIFKREGEKTATYVNEWLLRSRRHYAL